MQITVFFIAYTKKSTALSLRVLIIRSVSGLQITLRLLSSSLGNTVLLYTLFLEYETQIGQVDNVFQSNCSSHAKLLTNLRKIKKRPKIRLFMHSALQLLQTGCAALSRHTMFFTSQRNTARNSLIF